MNYEKPFTWNGKSYLSIRAAARDLGVCPSTIRRWRKRGYTCDNEVRRRKRNKRRVNWNGVWYSSMSEAATDVGVTPATMWLWLENGYTCDAHTHQGGDNRRNSKSVTWEGVTYPTILEASLVSSVCYETMRKYARLGYTSFHEIPNKNNNRKSVVWNDVRYKSITESAKVNGISRRSMQYRLRRGYTSDSDMGLTPAKAP